MGRSHREPKLIPCACGCGESIEDWDTKNKRERRYKPHHGRRMLFCRNGHDMSVYRAKCGDSSECGACRTQYNAEHHRSKKYMLSPEDVYDLITTQNNLCAICKQDWGVRGPHVDHDHKDGRVRGMLCAPCNMALGLFRDNIETLKTAISYLEICRA